LVGFAGNWKHDDKRCFMLEQRSIFVAGMPRAGSMWTYNVLRRLIVLAGKTPWPEKVPPDERSIIEEAFSKPAGAGRVYCIKTHFAIPVDQDNIKILCNFRDIRDATLSFMRFMKCPFETALDSARKSMNITDHYLGSGSLSVLPIDYDDVIGPSALVVGKIADFIGVEASDADIDEIVSQLSKRQMVAKLEKLDSVAVGQSGKIDSASAGGSYTSIKNADGSYRVYDYESGFQSNHITSIRAGEWR
jgi:hypothetical protein